MPVHLSIIGFPESITESCSLRDNGSIAPCESTAVHHVLLHSGEDGFSVLACDDHMKQMRQKVLFEDAHPVSTFCPLPGAFWGWDDNTCSLFDTEGYCE
jgi:hypothetical protein